MAGRDFKKPEPAAPVLRQDPPCLVRVYENGWRHAIHVSTGRTFVRYIEMGGSAGGLRVQKRLKSNARDFVPVPDYPMDKAIKHFQSAGRTFGISQTAARMLQDILDRKPVTGGDDTNQPAQTEGANSMSTIIESKQVKKYAETKSASGKKSLDNDDGVAKALRGMELEDVYKEASKKLDMTVRQLKLKYGRLNAGMQRMNLGNRLRKLERANKKG